MAYFLSPALVRLRAEINTLWPGRDKSSDGWIGDTAHSARKSDHNPDYPAGGIVRAIDVDKDGIPTDAVVAQIIRDPRVAYVIWNARIWENPAAYPGRGYWRAYAGANAHRQHFHVSVRHGARWDGNGSSWGITRTASAGGGGGGSLPDITVTPVAPIEEDDMYTDEDRQNANEIRRVLGVLGGGAAPATDGERKLVARLAALDALGGILHAVDECRRMLGVVLGWQPPQGPEKDAVKDLRGQKGA